MYWCRGLKAFTVLSDIIGQRGEVKDIQTGTPIYFTEAKNVETEREISKLTNLWKERVMSCCLVQQLRTKRREETEGRVSIEPHKKQEKKMVKGGLMRVGCVTQMISCRIFPTVFNDSLNFLPGSF